MSVCVCIFAVCFFVPLAHTHNLNICLFVLKLMYNIIAHFSRWIGLGWVLRRIYNNIFFKRVLATEAETNGSRTQYKIEYDKLYTNEANMSIKDAFSRHKDDIQKKKEYAHSYPFFCLCLSV